MQKNSKNHESLEKNFFSSKQLKIVLVYVSNTILEVLDKFQAKISQKRTWSIFTKISDPGYAKKIQKIMKVEKNFFSSKQFKIP